MIKRVLFVALFSITLSVLGTVYSYAMVVYDPTVHAQITRDDIQDFIKQGMIWVQNNGTNINTAALKYDQLVARPLKDAMTLMTITNSSKQITSLVNGSTNGNSLLVANPQKYIKEVGTQSVAVDYNAASKGGIYSDSIMNTLVQNARNSSNPTSNIMADTQSDIPATIQNNVCPDDQLSLMAENDITQGGVVDFDQAAYDARKQELYNALCTCDPYADKQCAQKLLAVNNQNPSVGGWDVWLKTTSGDNPYSKTTQAAITSAQKAASNQAAEQQDLNNGKGIKSAKTCVTYDDMGNCTEYAITNPSSAISDAFSKAKTAAFDTAKSTFGTGGDCGIFCSDLSGLLSFTADAYNTVSSASNALGGIGGSINNTTSSFDKALGNMGTTGSGAANTDSIINAARTPIANTSVVSSRSYTQDLANDPGRKANLVAQVQQILSTNLSSLSALTTTDNDYIAEINYYLGQVNAIKVCYENIEATASNANPPYAWSAQANAPAAYAFYSGTISLTQTLLAKITNERDVTVPAAKKIINDTLTAINNSNSSQEILDLTNAYQNQADNQGLPDMNTSSTRDGEYQAYKADVDTKMLNVEGMQGPIPQYNAQCATDGAAVQTAIQQRASPYQGNGGI